MHPGNGPETDPAPERPAADKDKPRMDPPPPADAGLRTRQATNRRELRIENLRSNQRKAPCRVVRFPPKQFGGPHGVPVAEGEGEAFSGLGSERVLSWSPNLWSSVCSASVCVRISAFSSFLLGSGRNNTATPPIINPNRKATSVLISHSFAIGYWAGCFSALFLYLGPNRSPAN